MARDRDILVRRIPARDVDRLRRLRECWPHDISQAAACRVAINRGLDASPEIQEGEMTQSVVTYSTLAPGVQLDLCPTCAEMDKPLGHQLVQVQHGAHDGVCERCSADEDPGPVRLLETYSRDKYSVYGLWEVTTPDLDTIEIAAVVGVQGYQRATADAAANWRGLIDVWHQDDSDLGGLTPERVEDAVEVLERERVAIVDRYVEGD
jgi:hypothetical protein